MSEHLVVVEGKDLLNALKRNGFVVVRTRGSAHFVEHPDGRRTTVHVHSGEALKRGTLRAILRDVGMTPEDLRALLTK